MPANRPTSSGCADPDGDATLRCVLPGRGDARTRPWPFDPAAALPDPPAGHTILSRLGGGGMGDVYLARETTTERTVAMKVLRSAADRELFDRFLVEVRALARLDHPNIIAIHAADLERKEPYFTMEYAAGGSLAALIERDGPLPPADAARLMATVARAVRAAHTAGILHRDLKPSNILLTGDSSGETSS